jgi:hypothetical protein
MKSMLSSLLLFFALPAIAQWTGPDAANRIFYSKGPVGIGIDLPVSRLHIKGVDSNSVLYAETPDAYLNFARHFIELRAKSSYAQTPYISWYTPSGLRQAFIGWRTDAFGLTLENNFNLSINGGNVGIGTVDTKGYKLAVVGKAIAEEVVVKLKSNWPDYVFDSLYNLSPLEKVAEYIRKYKRLPDVPAEVEIQSEGIPLGEFNALLLKKIEELTLYVIDERDRNRMLEERIRSLELTINTDDEDK